MSGTSGVSGTTTKNTAGSSSEDFSTNSGEYQEKTADGAENGQNDMEYYLQMQKEMLQEQQRFSALSTVMKARSDSAMTAIRHIKS
jgi:hypothetical protein